MSECLRREPQNLVRSLPRMRLQARAIDSRHSARAWGLRGMRMQPPLPPVIPPHAPDSHTCLRDRPVPDRWMVWRGRFLEFWADAQNSLNPISAPRDSTRTWSPTCACTQQLISRIERARSVPCGAGPTPQPVPCGAPHLGASLARCPCHTHRFRARPAPRAPRRRPSCPWARGGF